MAAFALVNGYFLFNAVNLSAWVTDIKFTYKGEILDITAMAALTRQRIGGLKDWSADIMLNQDFAASGPDVTIFPAIGTSVAIEIRPDAGARSTTNPGFTGNVIVESYDPVAGKVGAKAEFTLKLVGNGTLARQTS